MRNDGMFMQADMLRYLCRSEKSRLWVSKNGDKWTLSIDV